MSASALASYEGARPGHLRTPSRHALIAIVGVLGLGAAATNMVCEQLGYDPVVSNWALFLVGQPPRTSAPPNPTASIRLPSADEVLAEIDGHPFPCVVFANSGEQIAANGRFQRLTGSRETSDLFDMLDHLASTGHIANAREVIGMLKGDGLNLRTRIVLPVVWRTSRGRELPFNVVIGKWNTFIGARAMDWHPAAPETFAWMESG